MDILNEVWEEITAESVKNCWKKSTLINDDMTIETHANDNQSDTNDTEEMFGMFVSFVKIMIANHLEKMNLMKQYGSWH